MKRLVTLLNLTCVILLISSMIFLRMSEFSELLLMEFRKTGRRYLQVLVIYSGACNGGWSLDFLIGYRSLAIDVFGKNDAMWYGAFLCFKL